MNKIEEHISTTPYKLRWLDVDLILPSITNLQGMMLITHPKINTYKFRYYSNKQLILIVFLLKLISASI